MGIQFKMQPVLIFIFQHSFGTFSHASVFQNYIKFVLWYFVKAEMC